MNARVQAARAVVLAQNYVGTEHWASPSIFLTDMYTQCGIVWPGDEYSCKRMGWWVAMGDAKVGGPSLGDALFHVDGVGLVERMDNGWIHCVEFFLGESGKGRVAKVKHSAIAKKVRGFVRPGGFTQ
jgi:hypothetical protein